MYHNIISQTPLLLALSWREKIAAMSWLELVLWIGLFALTFALLVLVGTRWGQVRPVSKCVVLSVFAHLLFLCFAYLTHLSFGTGSLLGDPSVRISYISPDHTADGSESQAGQSVDTPAQKDTTSAERTDAGEAPARPEPDALVDTDSQKTTETQTKAPELSQAPTTQSEPSAAPPLLPDPKPSVPQPKPEPAPATTTSNEPLADGLNKETASESPAVPEVPVPIRPNVAANVEAESNESANQSKVQPPEPNQQRNSTDPTNSNSGTRDEAPSDVAAAGSDVPVRSVDGQPLPEVYRLRMAPDRLRFALSFGASEGTEAAVAAALVWLAAQQHDDGRWDASEFGAGRETRTLGQDRRGAGADADTGISGLALLAFLGAGYTHTHGDYRDTVQHGLEFLVKEQHVDGSLFGEAKLFERMYCHGIALLAVSEAYALTGDTCLLPALRRGVKYTLDSQDRVSGGWRYQPGERGDMSQFGWQVMALRSAELGGIEIPATNRAGMSKFLESVTQGANRGLASYRPGERATRTMTSEAMACRFLLGMPTPEAAVGEANGFLLQELPGQGEPNLYYWYYATLALFQAQGKTWDVWNDALKRHLLAQQRRDGRLAGSWDTRDVWGGYGGRVYTTAVATLCLEVYYRYLPIYDPANSVRHADSLRAPDPLRR